MNAIASGLTTIANGVFAVAGAVASPLVVGGVISTVSIAWLAATRLEELNRQGTKPTVQRH
jgi:hypothetical protein